MAALNASENAIAMLPQPFVTTAQSKNSNLRVALDLTEEWDKLQENAESPSTLVTGVVVARTEFIEQNPQAVEDFLKHYQESVDYVNKNVNEGAALVGKYDIVTEAVAQKAIPECNITFISGNEMKEKTFRLSFRIKRSKRKIYRRKTTGRRFLLQCLKKNKRPGKLNYGLLPYGLSYGKFVP